MKLSIHGVGLAAPIGDGALVRQALDGKDVPLPAAYETPTEALAEYVPARKLRRMDHFTRMTLLAAYRALEAADTLSVLPDRMGIVLGTGYGPSRTTFDFQDSLIDDGPALASPLAFSLSVHNIPAGVLSMLLDYPCPQTTLCQLRGAVQAGIQTAALWLAEGRVDTILLGFTDETTPLLEANTERLNAAEGRLDAPPVGEGSAFFLLAEAGGFASLEIEARPENFKADTVVIDQGEFGTCDLTDLWGKSPTSCGLELAAAALGAREQELKTACREGDVWFSVTGE
ncbi:beta-ketoacyl synthase chain length factor [Desulfovibrio sp. Huiquan2017]|uniref:beta-ketoacyl synthase chain length factor n=1 Tax=Desulfovibrio sp. Huiquan2017 TaxID=2816861 RepID=UPI001A925AFF|nr:beta-ketoacyl synthase chain length factor [Desulfovibrio sp. Huiquan2017]